MFIKPAPGMLIRHPVTRDLLPESGMDVDDNDRYFCAVCAMGMWFRSPRRSRLADRLDRRCRTLKERIVGNLSFNNIPQNLRVPLFSQKSTTAAPIPARQRNAR